MEKDISQEITTVRTDLKNLKKHLENYEKKIADLKRQKEYRKQQYATSKHHINEYIKTIWSDIGYIENDFRKGENFIPNAFDTLDNTIDKLSNLKDYFSATHIKRLQDFQKYISALFDDIKNANVPKTIHIRFEIILENLSNLIKQLLKEPAYKIINKRLIETENKKKSIEEQINALNEKLKELNCQNQKRIEEEKKRAEEQLALAYERQMKEMKKKKKKKKKKKLTDEFINSFYSS